MTDQFYERMIVVLWVILVILALAIGVLGSVAVFFITEAIFFVE